MLSPHRIPLLGRKRDLGSVLQRFAQLMRQDTTSALLRFPHGPICHFDCSLSRRTPSDAAVVVYGSRGQLNVHFVRCEHKAR